MWKLSTALIFTIPLHSLCISCIPDITHSLKQQFTHTSCLKKERKSDFRIYQSVIVKLSSTFFLHLTRVFEEV